MNLDLFFNLQLHDKLLNLAVRQTHNESGSILEFTENDYINGRLNISYSKIGEATAGSFQLMLTPKKDFDGMLSFGYAFSPDREPYFMIPGSLYGTNNIKNSKSRQPQLNYRGDICYPKTPVIFTRADRSTHNAVLAIYNDMLAAFRIDESTLCENELFYNGLFVDTRHYDNLDRVGMTVGYMHFPVRYLGKLGPHSITEGFELGYIPFTKGKAYSTKGQVYLSPAADRFAYEAALKWFYGQIHEHPGNNVNRMDAVRDIGSALAHDAYQKDHKYFPTVLSGAFADTRFSGDTAWTGGMQVVYPLVSASRHYPELLPIATDYIDELLTNGINPESGFFYESKDDKGWKVSGWWQNDLLVYNKRFEKLTAAHSAYVNGQATCYLLKSYRLAKKEGWQIENLEKWFEIPKRIIDKVISMQRYDGALGVYFDPADGDAVYYNSFQGAWFLAGIAELAALTGEDKYFDAFRRAEEFYYAFIRNVEAWGMPMDTRDAVDEEGNLAYITALKTIHEINKDKALLEKLVHALHYEFSWKFAYNTRHVNEPLKSMNWPSSGGSITSSHNIHIHQMGNLIAEEMYYAYLETQDAYILSRLKDTLNWGLGTYNIEDNWFGFGKKGWATEQFFHSDGKQDDPNRIVDGGIWPDYLCWAAACVLLSSAADIPEEYYKA